MGFLADAAVIEAMARGRDAAMSAVQDAVLEPCLQRMWRVAAGPDRDAFLLAAMRVMALGRNGHSRVIPNAAIHVAPYRIVQRDGAAMLIADGRLRQIRSVNGRASGALIRAWSSLLAGTAARQRVLGGIMLAWPAALAEAGAERSGDVIFDFYDGGTRHCRPGDLVTALPLFPVSDTGWITPDADDDAPATGAPVMWDQGVWRIRIPDLVGSTMTSITQIAEILATRPKAGLVIDLRGNPGGDFTKTLGLLEWVHRHWRGPACAILVNAYTFSAAIVAAALFKHRLGARAQVIGEEMGDDLCFYAEGGTEPLVESGAAVRFSTAWHDWATGRVDDTTPSDIACHMVGVGQLDVQIVPVAQQTDAAIAYARGQ